MSYRVEKLPDEPIVLATLNKDFSMSMFDNLVNDVYEILDQLNESIYYISDVRHITLSWDNLLKGVSMVSRGKNPLLQHPRIIENLAVTNSKMLRMLAKGMQHPVFGNVSIQAFDSLDDAIEYIHQSEKR